MDYLIVGTFGLIIALHFWLTRVIKKAVVQPVADDGKLMDARLSEKKRHVAIMETHGFAIGFWTALGLVVLVQWVLQ